MIDAGGTPNPGADHAPQIPREANGDGRKADVPIDDEALKQSNSIIDKIVLFIRFLFSLFLVR